MEDKVHDGAFAGLFLLVLNLHRTNIHIWLSNRDMEACEGAMGW